MAQASPNYAEIAWLYREWQRAMQDAARCKKEYERLLDNSVKAMERYQEALHAQTIR